MSSKVTQYLLVTNFFIVFLLNFLKIVIETQIWTMNTSLKCYANISRKDFGTDT